MIIRSIDMGCQCWVDQVPGILFTLTWNGIGGHHLQLCHFAVHAEHVSHQLLGCTAHFLKRHLTCLFLHLSKIEKTPVSLLSQI